MPKKLLDKQKRYMRRFLKKPLDMKVKGFVERVITMNELLTRFPDAIPAVPAAKIPDKEILDLLESAIPNSWQRHMVLQGFSPMDRTITELVDFCNRVELTKELLVVKKTSHEKTGRDHNKSGKKRGEKLKCEGGISSPYNCMLHGPNKFHSTEDCYALKNLVKGNKNRKKDPRPKKSKRSEEMNALMSYVKKHVVFKKNQDAEAKAAHAEELNNFESMLLDNLQPEDGIIKSDK